MEKSRHEMTLQELHDEDGILDVYSYISPRVVELFWAKVDASGGPDACWPYQKASRNQCDYGIFCYTKGKSRGGMIAAHKMAYILSEQHLWEQPLAKREVVMHKCRNRSSDRDHDLRCCCNPKHLKRGTQKENIHDMIKAGTFKPWGKTMLIARGKGSKY